MKTPSHKSSVYTKIFILRKVYQMNKYISPNIPLNVIDIIEAIHKRQGLPWNCGRINDNHDFDILQELFDFINSGIPKEDFCYQGDIYRLHSSYTGESKYIDINKEFIAGKICSDDSCSILPITVYSNVLVSFSKSCDFTRPVYYKVCPSEMAICIHSNTKDLYGIDINAITTKFGNHNPRLVEEKEILFPLSKDYVIKEYKCSPNQFNYYLRSLKSNK